MADFAQGDIVRDYFTVTDSAGNDVLNALFEVGATEDPNGDSFTLEVTNVGSGVYKVEFLAELVGTYYYRVDTTNLSPNQMWEETFTIGPAQLYGAALGTAAYGNTLNDLIRRLATRVGDFREVIATADGAMDGTSFQDQLRLAAIPSTSLKGAGLTTVSPQNSVNYMQEVRISDSAEETQVLTLQPPLPGRSLIGDVAWITNLHSRGYWRNQYTNALNEVIAAAHPVHLVPVDYTYPSVFNADDPSIPAPLHLTHIYGVQYYNSDGFSFVLPYSDQNLRSIPGWSVDYATGRILVNGSFQSVMNGWSVRLMGYGRAAELVNPDDYTTLPTSFLVPAAANILKMGTGDQKQLALASMLSNMSNEYLVSAITHVEPGTIRIR